MVTLEDVQVASPQAGVAVVTVADELDLATRSEFSALLGALIQANELVVVDLSETRFIDSSTLHALLSGYKLARERGKTLRLQLGDECVVKRALEVTGLLDELSWASSREEALDGSAPATRHDDPGHEAERDRTAWNLPRRAKRTHPSGSVQSRAEDKSEPEPEAA
jgi:anti-sigma B factor antagonist